jgi:hypothetical protein
MACVALRDCIGDPLVPLDAAVAAAAALADTLVAASARARGGTACDDSSVVDAACEGLRAAVARGPDAAAALASAAPSAVPALLAALQSPVAAATTETGAGAGKSATRDAARCALAGLAATNAGAAALTASSEDGAALLIHALCQDLAAAASPNVDAAAAGSNAGAGTNAAANVAALAALSVHASTHAALVSAGAFAALVGVLTRARRAVPVAMTALVVPVLDADAVGHAARLVANAVLTDDALEQFVAAGGTRALALLLHDCLGAAAEHDGRAAHGPAQGGRDGSGRGSGGGGGGGGSSGADVALAATLCEALCTISVSRRGADALCAAGVLPLALRALDTRPAHADPSHCAALSESAAWTLRNLCRDAAVARACACAESGGLAVVTSALRRCSADSQAGKHLLAVQGVLVAAAAAEAAVPALV